MHQCGETVKQVSKCKDKGDEQAVQRQMETSKCGEGASGEGLGEGVCVEVSACQCVPKSGCLVKTQCVLGPLQNGCGAHQLFELTAKSALEVGDCVCCRTIG